MEGNTGEGIDQEDRRIDKSIIHANVLYIMQITKTEQVSGPSQYVITTMYS